MSLRNGAEHAGGKRGIIGTSATACRPTLPLVSERKATWQGSLARQA
jgi:hypothetical protein